MRFWLRRRLTVVAAAVVCITPLTAPAEDWLLVETRLLPQSCVDVNACVSESQLVLRNVMKMARQEAVTFTRLLKSMATVPNVEDEAVYPLCQAMMQPELHALPKASRPELLANHLGVFLDSSKVDGTETLTGFSERLKERFSQAGLRFLSKEQMEATPGRPIMTFSYSPRRETAGCIIPYSFSLSIKEEAVLIRNTTLKSTSTIWSATIRENLAIRHFTPESALEEAIEKFLKDWAVANPGG